MYALSTTSYASNPFALLVEEALAAILAPARRREILGEALESADVDDIPDQPMALRVFLEGALFTTLARHLEVSDALELVAQIRSTLELAMANAPDERPRSEVRERITLPAPPTTALVLTNASLVVFLLADALGDAPVEVVPVSNRSELEDRLRRMAGRSLLVVVDRKHACVDVSVCSELRDELDPFSTVVWWGARGAERTMASAMLAGGPRMIACEADLGLADLGELCRRLVDEPS